jgi:hypothetical protein
MAIDLDAIRKRVDALNGKKVSFSNVKLWKPTEGEHTIRILPWKETDTKEGMPFIERQIYFGIGKRPIVSPRSFGKPDPIDDFIRKLYDEARDGKPESKALADKLRPKLQTCAAIVDRADEAAGVQLWTMNVMVVRDVFGLFLNKQVGNFMDVVKGRDLTVTLSPSPKKFNGKTVFDTKVMPSFTAGPASEDPEQLKKWMENLPDVNEFYRPQSYEEIKAIFEEWLANGGPDSASRGGNAPAPATAKTAENQVEAVAAALKKNTSAKSSAKNPADIEDSIDSMLKELDQDEDV